MSSKGSKQETQRRHTLKFKASALEEFKALTQAVKDQFKKKLAERLDNPRVPSAKLAGQKNRYKIKLKASGYRLVYEVIDDEVVVEVIAVGKRERNAVYKAAAKR